MEYVIFQFKELFLGTILSLLTIFKDPESAVFMPNKAVLMIQQCHFQRMNFIRPEWGLICTACDDFKVDKNEIQRI